MTNVLFFLGTLYPGGTEAKIARNFLPLLKREELINPKLLLLRKKGEFIDILPPEIEIFSLNENKETNFIEIIPRFIKVISKIKVDVVVSCMWYPAIISYFARKFINCKFRHIIHDTTNMSEYIKYEFRDEKFKSQKIYLFRKAYKNADKIIVVSYGEKEDLVTNFGIPEKLIKVIYNPIDIEKIREMSNEKVYFKKDKPTIFSMGRLIYSKGFDILFNAFKKVTENVDCKLFILGDGPERKKLEKLRNTLKLNEKIFFLGFHHNPFKYLKYADLFCIATRYEGLCNSIIEAMSLGLPIVATDCKSGPAETLSKGKYGILVPTENPDALAEAILKVLIDKELRLNLSNLSLMRADNYRLEKLLPEWKRILIEK